MQKLFPWWWITQNTLTHRAARSRLGWPPEEDDSPAPLPALSTEHYRIKKPLNGKCHDWLPITPRLPGTTDMRFFCFFFCCMLFFFPWNHSQSNHRDHTVVDRGQKVTWNETGNNTKPFAQTNFTVPNLGVTQKKMNGHLLWIECGCDCLVSMTFRWVACKHNKRLGCQVW